MAPHWNMTILESIQLVHAYQPSSICSSDFTVPTAWAAQYKPGGLTVQTVNQVAFSMVFCRIWSAIDSYCYIHLQARLSIHVYSLTQWIFQLKEELLSPWIAALLVELITVGMVTYDACAKRIGTKDPSFAEVPSTPYSQMLIHCSSLVSYPNHDTAGTHNRSSTSTSTTLSWSLLNHFLSICTAIHCHSLHSAISLHYRLTSTKSLRQVAN